LPEENLMAANFVLMLPGIFLAIIVRQVQAYLLRWQPQFSAQT
jgi:NitT/TauT family transport system permease protein